ncbi:glutaredoxin family protein [Aquabacterium humicola]|uniref:glutaredoxin family protein n=1 Tax=Aquabacterium humicola TaxID=3237377 RepID=UPI002543B1CC|nr:glutaredoxin family protein [Rubrivivax pictus]
MKRSLVLAAACLAVLPAFAQYKVVGPDGRITYTDRPPPAAQGQVSAMRRDGAVASTPAAPLPAELRPVVARFPVVLFTAPECELCDNARTMLKQRGIPLTERQVMRQEDLVAVERATGSRGMPAMTVGAQAINGWSSSQWNALLDLAGYPRESKLPRDYQAAAPQPITPRPAPPPPVPVAPPAPSPDVPEAPEPAASGIRF